jgi:cytochrome b561
VCVSLIHFPSPFTSISPNTTTTSTTTTTTTTTVLLSYLLVVAIAGWLAGWLQGRVVSSIVASEAEAMRWQAGRQSDKQAGNKSWKFFEQKH